MIKWIFAALLIVNLAVFLWPAGNKAPFFDASRQITAPAVNAGKMQLLTENMAMDRTGTSLPAVAIPSNAPTPRPVDSTRSRNLDSGPVPVPLTVSTPSGVVVPSSAPPGSDIRSEPSIRVTPQAVITQPASPMGNPDSPDQVAGVPAAATAPSQAQSVQPIARPAMTAPAKPPVPVKTPLSAASPDVGADRAAADPPAPVEDRPLASIAPGICLRVGPILDDASMQRAAERLTDAGAGFRERTVSAREVRTWRVYIGPLDNDQATSDIEGQLTAAGITDRYIAREPDGTRIVSLGVFSASKTANNLMAGLADRSIDAAVRPEIRKLRPTRWLEILAPGLPPAAAKLLEIQGIDGTRVRIKPIECVVASG